MTKKTEQLTPWEDTLILAFRDLQWLRKQDANTEALMIKFENERKKITQREYFDWVKETLKRPPPLLAKLDGHAESASADVLTAQNDRFFLLEFKSSLELFRKEEEKYIKKVMNFVVQRPFLYDSFIDLSVRGHFLVYPTFAQGSCGYSGSLLPIHEATLRSAPYYQVCSLTTTLHSQKPEDSRTLERVIWEDKLGLTMEEMTAYLFALSQNHGTTSGGHPMKVVVASAEGMVWPIADLSQLATLQTYFSNQTTYSEPIFDVLMVSLENFIQDFKKSLALQTAKPKSNKLDNGKSKSIPNEPK